MFFLRTILTLGSLALLGERSVRAAEPAPPAQPELIIENLSEETKLVNDFQSRTWVGSNGIIIRQGDTILIANEVRVDEVTRQAVAEGMVTLQSGALFWTGEHLEYNFNTREIGASSYRAGVGSRAFLQAENMAGSPTNKVFEATNALFTTDDLQPPGYHVRAKKVRIEEGKEVVAEGATLYMGKVPVFYLPHYRRSLGPHPNYFVVTPGYRSTFGPYLLTSYHLNAHENFDVGMNLDYRAKRGPGFGPEFAYDLPKVGKGEFDYYFARDWEMKNEPRLAGYSDDRQRIRFAHQTTLQTNLTLKANVNYQSDPLMLHDLFEGEYRTNAQPKTVFEVTKLWSNFSLDAVAQPQVNTFFPTVERLPDIKLSALRQQLGISPFYYEGESSFAYLRNRPGAGGTNYAAMRGDTYHQLVLPWTFFGFLNVTPRAGARLTHYSETESPLVPLDEENRFVFNTGVETSFKASRVFSGARSRLLDVTELRHIIEPSVNYVYVPHPNVRPGRIPQFDTEVPSLRLLPVDFPDYNQIDSIDGQNVFRLGLRNKFQTKRDGEIDTLANWFLVTDWRLDPKPTQKTFSDIYSDLDFKPARWILLNSETRFNMDRMEWNLASHSVMLTPNEQWSVRLGHRYYRGEPEFGPNSDNNIIFSTLYYRFNENWGARVSHHFEARDGTMEEQYYSVYRDFRSFTGALTFRVRDQRVGPIDYAVAFTMHLKANPTKAGKDRLEPSFLLGN